MLQDIVSDNFEEVRSDSSFSTSWHEDVPEIQVWRKAAASNNEELVASVFSVRSHGSENATIIRFLRGANLDLAQPNWGRADLTLGERWLGIIGLFQGNIASVRSSNSLDSENALKLESIFHQLADNWRNETAYISSFTQLVMHPSYQSIIGMGPIAIPWLLAELKREPSHWFWALAAIARENPVEEEHAGDLEQMTKAWLEWGSMRGYV